MRIFITGASGFIGGAIAEAMASDHEVFAMSRSDKSDLRVKELGATPVRCDLATLAPNDLPVCDVAIHCAARVEPWGTREDFWHANVDGTELKASGSVAAFVAKLAP